MFANALAALTLTYFPVAARGELARLYAASGGLDIIDSTNTTDYKTTTPFGLLPVLDHPEAGLLRLQESLAIERYISSIAPGFNALTPAQRAVDDEFACIKEDSMVVEGCMENASTVRTCVSQYMERYLALLEQLVPVDSFVHGLGYPTGADLATLLIAMGGFPWGRAMRLAGYTDWPSRFPKVAALTKRTAAWPAVAHYLDVSTTFFAKIDPDLPPEASKALVSVTSKDIDPPLSAPSLLTSTEASALNIERARSISWHTYGVILGGVITAAAAALVARHTIQQQHMGPDHHISIPRSYAAYEEVKHGSV